MWLLKSFYRSKLRYFFRTEILAHWNEKGMLLLLHVFSIENPTSSVRTEVFFFRILFYFILFFFIN